MEQRVQQAVILAAGQGLRLRKNDQDYLKPLYPLRGRPLISYVMDGFFRNGVRRFYVVVGFEKEALIPGLQEALPQGAELTLVDNPDWSLKNGISLLKARDRVQGRFFLSMSDHLFEPDMVARLEAGAASQDSLYLAVDRKLDSIFDMDDATKVRTDGDRIADIGKQLTEFDAVDTGLFICPASVFDCLQRAQVDGDCSLSDGVHLLAQEGKARIVDVGDSRWQDVDDHAMLGHAESLAAGPGFSRPS